jgi:hypothetical protein
LERNSHSGNLIGFLSAPVGHDNAMLYEQAVLGKGIKMSELLCT